MSAPSRALTTRWLVPDFDAWQATRPPRFRPLALANALPFGRPDCNTRRRGNGVGGEEVSPETVDPGILPLVSALNATGLVRTCASCEGHWNSTHHIEQPYVLFEADMQFAKEWNAWIAEARTTFLWEIWGRFASDGSFQFRLSSSVWNLPLWDLYPWERAAWWRWYRRGLDDDIERLCAAAILASRAQRANTQQTHEPCRGARADRQQKPAVSLMDERSTR